MKRIDKQDILNKLISELPTYEDPKTYHYEFGTWREMAIRRLSELFGKDSLHVASFKRIEHVEPDPFLFEAYGSKHMSKLPVSMAIHKYSSLLQSFEEELTDDSYSKSETPVSTTKKKVFISHSSSDKQVVSEIVSLLSLIGVPDGQIFCTSLPGYDIDLGDNWLDTLKKEITEGAMVLFLLSENYFQSTISLCEMGAAWVLSKEHVPILLPYMDYNSLKSVIPFSQAMKINEKHKWTKLKGKLEKILNIESRPPEVWESRRDEILARIEELTNP